MNVINEFILNNLPFCISLSIAFVILITLIVIRKINQRNELLASLFYLIVEYIEALESAETVRVNHNIQYDDDLNKQYLKNFEMIAKKLDIPIVKIKAPTVIKNNVDELKKEHTARLTEITSDITTLLNRLV